LGQAFANRTEDELLQADMWLAQGRLWYEKGIDRTDVMKKALEIFQRNGEVERVAQTLNHLGNAYMRLQKPETAIPYYQEGLEALQTLATSTFSIHERREWQAIINGNLGIVLGRQGQYAEACQTLYEILPDLVDKADYAEVYALLAYYELQQGHKEKAYQLRHQTDQLIEFLGIIDPICEEDRSWRELHEG
jgi:tetratricopeptide (TPR) repeat protein